MYSDMPARLYDDGTAPGSATPLTMRNDKDHSGRRAEGDVESMLCKAVFEAAVDAIVVMDEAGRIRMANPATERLFGYRLDELGGQDVAMLMPEPYNSGHGGYLRDYLQTGERNVIGIGREVPARHRDGTVFPIYLSLAEVRKADRRYFAGIIHDLSAQKAIENALRESEDYMRLTLEHAPIGIGSADLEGRLLDVNPAFAALLGYAREELVGMRVTDITHPEDREDTRRQFASLVAGEIPYYTLQKRYLHKDGGVIHVRAQAGLVRDATGQPIRVVGEVEDETERLRSAQEIQRMRAYLENIIDSMPSVLVGVDTEGRVTEWNRSAERSTGIASGEAVGRAFGDLFPQLSAQMHDVSEAIRRQEPIRTERLLMKQDGETRYAQIMVYPLLANGAAGAVIRMDDITERIRIEQMMVQTEKMLTIGGLAAGMAHEISNPLSIILQSAQHLGRRVAEDLPANRVKADELGLDLHTMGRYLEARGVTEFIAGIQEAGARASRIVADMLAFSRRSASRLTPNRLDDMLETVLRLAASDYDLKKHYDFRQIEIERDYDPGLGEVPCDRTQIEQVLLNLVKNAAHAVADAGTTPRRIRLRTFRHDGFACIEVEDNGPGMDETTRKRAFEPFFTTKEAGVGTGLGLSVSYFIITEQHRGTISVSSRAGGGCCFTIRLPLAGAEAA
jgi:PAS domain S-box-containing protein